jgi:hypothetical protein
MQFPVSEPEKRQPNTRNMQFAPTLGSPLAGRWLNLASSCISKHINIDETLIWRGFSCICLPDEKHSELRALRRKWSDFHLT